jgi:glycosyltransferase involved in cell wall biosynthesis
VLAGAFRQLRDAQQPVELYVVGLGPYSSALADKIPDAIFTGDLSGDALAKAYASADIFVFPSTTDTFGNVVLEAQASGLPAVVSDLGGPKELVVDGYNGFITKARDIGGVVTAITRLIDDKEMRRLMGENARHSVLERNWPDAFRKFWRTTAD